jgi:hypothetical protein
VRGLADAQVGTSHLEQALRRPRMDGVPVGALPESPQ